jgi:hypothetical protein
LKQVSGAIGTSFGSAHLNRFASAWQRVLRGVLRVCAEGARAIHRRVNLSCRNLAAFPLTRFSMSDDLSPVLSLPLIQPAQAQKHVTHNEALRMLDVLVQPVVASRTTATPPPFPAQGARFIVPAGATGAWAGQDGAIAWRDGDGWSFLTPQPGWQVQVLDEGRPAVFTGSAWESPAEQPQQFPRLGVATAADATNRLAVAAPATLLTHAGAGHQLKINKAGAAETASLLFQTGWSGRAELGTTGSDDLAFKVSPDGSTWHNALTITATSGVPDLQAGATIGGSLAYRRANILGTVSQSGGVPTGAVIERGSNANGEYVRFADGTQICTRHGFAVGAINVADGALFRTETFQITMAATFAAAPVVLGGPCSDPDAFLTPVGATVTIASLRAAPARKGPALPQASLPLAAGSESLIRKELSGIKGL